MIRTLGRGLLFLPLAAAAQRPRELPTVELRPGLVITRSVRVVNKSYRLSAPASLDSSLIIIRGDNLTVDFAGATLEGAAPTADPDLAAGVAIRIEGGRNVHLLRARVRGYKIGVLARDVRGLTLAENDLSHNWKPRLFSLVEHESLADWLSFHHNEQHEWLRFGAAIYLERVTGGEIRANRAEQGMNGLLMTRSDSLTIRDNSFSFNSGLGIGLYRSSDNTIVYNRVDYDVRGYSHGFYRRGQDSADILLYEQSSHNTVMFNSATHGGDGLFLWAGQSTMDTGQGGVNDNLFYGNDFSFAPANAMEATFSKNTFVANRAEGSDYGLWGGYSHDSQIIGNCFVRNRVGIAIEHGQHNRIALNRFVGDSTAISVWANPIESSDWGYPKHRDTKSVGYEVERNWFEGNRVALRAANTSELVFRSNRLLRVDSLAVLRDTANYRADANDDLGGESLRAFGPCVPWGLPAEYARQLRGLAHAVPSTPASHRDRSAIVVDEWGPYDWRSPKLWPVDSSRAIPSRLAVLGPRGTWRVVERRGIKVLTRARGRTGDTVSVTPVADSAGDWALTLEYRGGATTSPRGEQRAAGQAYRFSYARFEPRADWTVRFFAWSDSTDPRAQREAFAALLGTTPLLTRRESRLDYEWYRPAFHELPQANFALEATANVTLDPGTYTLRTVSDDAVRVWVDGALVIDHWTPHASAPDFAALAGGRHELRVQYFQADGWVELRLDIVRGTQRSSGSPGPH